VFWIIAYSIGQQAVFVPKKRPFFDVTQLCRKNFPILGKFYLTSQISYTNIQTSSEIEAARTAPLINEKRGVCG